MKNQRRDLLLVLGALSLGSSTSAFAQFGGLGGLVGGGGSGGGGDVGAQVEDFIKKSVVLSTLAAKALAKINSAFESEEELAKKRAELEEIEKITDPKEKQARVAKLYESERAKTASLVKSADLKEKMTGLDEEKKKSIGQALFNFVIAALRAPGLIDSGQKILQGVQGNPMNITKVVPVKDAVPLIQKFIEDSTGTVGTFIKVAKGANISVPEAKSDSTPVEVPV